MIANDREIGHFETFSSRNGSWGRNVFECNSRMRRRWVESAHAPAHAFQYEEICALNVRMRIVVLGELWVSIWVICIPNGLPLRISISLHQTRGIQRCNTIPSMQSLTLSSQGMKRCHARWCLGKWKRKTIVRWANSGKGARTFSSTQQL